MSTMIFPQQSELQQQMSGGDLPFIISAEAASMSVVNGRPSVLPSPTAASKPLKPAGADQQSPLTSSKDSVIAVGVPASTAVMPPIDDDDLRLEVTCGQNQAVLYTSRLQLGSKGTCVLFENAWLTPNEFQYVSGRETAKDWKRSIKHHGKSLKVLIAKGILSTTPPARCDCGQCTVPKKDNEISSWKSPSEGGPMLSPGIDAAKAAAAAAVAGVGGSVVSCDALASWRMQSNGVVRSSSMDVGLNTGSSAFRSPLDGLRGNGQPGSAIDGSATRLSDVQATGAPPQQLSPHAGAALKSADANNFTTPADPTPTDSSSLSGGLPSSSSSDSVRKSAAPLPQKRPRSPLASDLDSPPAKTARISGSNSTSDGSTTSPSTNGGYSGRQASAGVEPTTSSSSAERSRHEFSSPDGHRRRENNGSSSSNGTSSSSSAARRCQTPRHSTSDSASFRSPNSSHHHSQSSSFQPPHKTSPATASAAPDRLGHDSASSAKSQSPYVISPLAASPYFPFLTSSSSSSAVAAAAAAAAASQLGASSMCYPNPYMNMMLPLAAAAVYNPAVSAASQFPYSWTSPTSAPSPVKSVSEQLRSSDRSTAAAFDFPWMRGVPPNPYSASSKLSPPMSADPYESQILAAKQSLGLAAAAAAAAAAAQNPYSSYMRGAAAAGGFGSAASALLTDGFDAYCRRSMCELPGVAADLQASSSFFDSQSFGAAAAAAAAGAGFGGVYPNLFQSPYFGIPSR